MKAPIYLILKQGTVMVHIKPYRRTKASILNWSKWVFSQGAKGVYMVLSYIFLFISQVYKLIMID